MKKLFCRIGWHWLTNYQHSFVDIVSGKSVYKCDCSCKKHKWLTDSIFPLFGFRIKVEEEIKQTNINGEEKTIWKIKIK
jgi:hypothetical protein